MVTSLVFGVLGNVARMVWWPLRHPILTGAAALLVLAWLIAGWPLTVAILVIAVAALLVWRVCWPSSFDRRVSGRLWARWRLWSGYSRGWQPAMVACSLSRSYGGREYLPAVRRLSAGRWVDRLQVELLTGQTPRDMEAVAEQLAHTFGALRCAVRGDGPPRVWLDFYRADPLQTPIPALPVPSVPDLRRLSLGVREDGRSWQVGMLGSHILVAGATGSGKGSVVWSLIRALSPALRGGWVQLWGVDPKGGMELTFAADVFTRLAYATTGEMLILLEDAVGYLRDRQARLLGVTRLHEPTRAEPLIVVVVDELAALIAYVDRDTKKRASDALQLLLSQGRAVGVLVVAAVQDPGKDIVPFRDLFPTRIALRLVEDTQVDMVLGRGARERGAYCDRIPASLPGVGYVVLDGVREPVRVRAAHVTDQDLAALCAAGRGPAEAQVIRLDPIPIVRPADESTGGAA